MNEFLYRLGLRAVGAVGDALSLRKRAIICFHSVAAPGDPLGGMSICGAFLERLILDCKARSVAIVSLASAIERLSVDDPAPFVALTFDDGYRDNFDVAFPILQRHGVPFTIFVTTGLVDRIVPMWWHLLERAVASKAALETPWGRVALDGGRAKAKALARLDASFRQRDPQEQAELCAALVAANALDDDGYGTALDWSMIAAMAKSGLAEIGCHTMTHPLLAACDAERLHVELAEARARIAAMTGQAPAYLAYPFGQPHEVGARAPEVARAAGFSAAFTTQARVLDAADLARPFDLPRIMLARKAQDPRILRAYLSGLPELRRRPVRPRIQKLPLAARTIEATRVGPTAKERPYAV